MLITDRQHDNIFKFGVKVTLVKFRQHFTCKNSPFFHCQMCSDVWCMCDSCWNEWNSSAHLADIFSFRRRLYPNRQSEHKNFVTDPIIFILQINLLKHILHIQDGGQSKTKATGFWNWFLIKFLKLGNISSRIFFPHFILQHENISHTPFVIF